MAEPIGDDETFRRGLAESRAALGRSRPRPRPVPDPEVAADDDPPAADDRDDRIAALEAENRRLRAALATIHRESGTALDR